MRDTHSKLLAELRARALQTERRRKTMKSERQELEATIDALSELTDLGRGELENMYSSVRREIQLREQDWYRRPTLLGMAIVIALATSLLYWGGPILVGKSQARAKP